MDHQDQDAILNQPVVNRQKEVFDEEAAFSFRKKKTPKKQPFVGSATTTFDRSPSLAPQHLQPHKNSTLSPSPSPLKSSIDSATRNVRSLVTDFESQGCQWEDEKDVSDWELVWEGSWIVPALEPMTSSSSSGPTSASRKAPASLKKASLDNRQQTTFQGPDGTKFLPSVTELSGMVLAISKSRPPGSTGPTLQSEEKQIMRENTEMHLIAKIRLSSFPIFLLMPGCTEPCRVFTSSESKASAQFLKELFDYDDIEEMKRRCRDGDESVVGQIGLLLRVTSKPGQSTKKKGMLSTLARQDVNPFLQPSGQGEMSDDLKRKVYQETSMFLVYGVLADDEEHSHPFNVNSAVQGRKSSNKNSLPAISFFAYPLVDQVHFSEQMLLNTRSMDRLKQDAEEARLVDPVQSKEANTFVQYEDPIVDSIMNGCDDDDDDQERIYGSEWTCPDMEIDEDESLQQEMGLLKALERTKTWSPYTVLAPPNTPSTATNPSTNPKDVSKDRIFSRTQTLDRMTFSNKGSSVRPSNSLSRHRSMDSQSKGGGMLSTAANPMTTITAAKVIRKGNSRLKSPSRAPQQMLGVTTESLRRRLLGPGSVRTELSLVSSSSISPSLSTKSIEARNKA
ncbi:hypothetical protein BGZ58_003559, partial [Dissophora ornata]